MEYVDTTPKYIKGYDNKYLLTHLGEVYSTYRLLCNGNKIPEKRLLKTFIKNSSPSLELTNNGIKKKVKPHRLLLEYFPDNPKICVRCNTLKPLDKYRTPTQKVCRKCRNLESSIKSRETLNDYTVKRMVVKKNPELSVDDITIDVVKMKRDLIKLKRNLVKKYGVTMNSLNLLANHK